MNAADLKPLLPGYSPAELQQLLGAGQDRTFPPGALLCREGAPGQSCFLLVKGEVEVVKSIDGGERVLATLRPGAMVGQVTLVDRSPRSATVRARGETTTLEIMRDAFERLLGARSPLALRFQEQIAVAGIRQLRAATERLTLLLGRAARPASAAPARVALATIQAATSEWEIPLEEVQAIAKITPRRW